MTARKKKAAKKKVARKTARRAETTTPKGTPLPPALAKLLRRANKLSQDLKQVSEDLAVEMEDMLKGIDTPGMLSPASDSLLALRDARDACGSAREGLHRVYDDKAYELRDLVTSYKLRSIGAEHSTFTPTTQEVLTITDKAEFLTFALKRTGGRRRNLDLLPDKLCKIAPYRERQQAGEEVPGVQVDEIQKYSLTKKR